MTKYEAAVVRAATAWWKSHRPCGFTHRKHLRCPMVNTFTPVENRLAQAVATLIRSKGKP